MALPASSLAEGTHDITVTGITVGLGSEGGALGPHAFELPPLRFSTGLVDRAFVVAPEAGVVEVALLQR